MTPKPKKSEPVSFRIDENTYSELEELSTVASRKRNELARLIFEWAFPIYKQAGSYDALRKLTVAANPGSVIHNKLTLDASPSELADLYKSTEQPKRAEASGVEPATQRRKKSG